MVVQVLGTATFVLFELLPAFVAGFGNHLTDDKVGVA